MEMMFPATGTSGQECGHPEQEVEEEAPRKLEGVPGRAGREGSQSSLGSPLSWGPTKPCVSGLADKEKLGPLLTCMSRSSTYVFTHVPLDKASPAPRVTKTF